MDLPSIDDRSISDSAPEEGTKNLGLPNLASIKAMDHANPRHAQFVVVSWNITSLCNFRCPYCSTELNGGHYPDLPIEVCRDFVDRVMNHYSGSFGKKVYFELTGGEATLFPALAELLQHIKSRGGYTGLMSNGSLPSQKWTAIMSVLDHLCLSFHPRQSRPAQFLELAERIHPIVSTHFNIMMYPPLFDKSLEMAKSLRSILTNSSISLQPLLESLKPGMPMIMYSDHQKKIMEAFDCSVPWNKDNFSTRGGMKVAALNGDHFVVQVPQMVLGRLNRWKGWTCWAGLECITVKVDGEVFSAWCLQDKLGTIQSQDLTFPTSPTICLRDSCHSPCDMMTRKLQHG